MGKELIIPEMPVDMQNMSDEQFDIIRTQMLIEQNRRMEKQIISLRDANLKMSNKLLVVEETQIQQGNDYKTSLEKQYEFDEARYGDDYITRKNIGKLYTPTISSVRMTKLLKVVHVIGLDSFPLAERLSGRKPLAKVVKEYNKGVEYDVQLYHVQRIKRVVRNWLEKHDELIDFRNCKNKKEIDKFIDDLFLYYVEDVDDEGMYV